MELSAQWWGLTSVSFDTLIRVRLGVERDSIAVVLALRDLTGSGISEKCTLSILLCDKIHDSLFVHTVMEVI